LFGMMGATFCFLGSPCGSLFFCLSILAKSCPV
jgi:hypothetical protein